MKINSLLTTIFLAGTLLTTVACSTVAQDADNPGQAAKEISITSQDEFTQNPHIQKQIEISKGDTLVITLVSNASTGFSWNEAATISDASVLKQASHQNIAAPSDKVGAAGTEQWKLDSLKTGTTSVHLEYGRPWAGGEKAVWTVDIAVTVK
jgi:inhibitor of cysteine peptidase